MSAAAPGRIELEALGRNDVGPALVADCAIAALEGDDGGAPALDCGKPLVRSDGGPLTAGRIELGPPAAGAGIEGWFGVSRPAGADFARSELLSTTAEIEARPRGNPGD